MPEPPALSMQPENQVSVPVVWAVVLNWNGFDDTTLCIQSLKQADYPSLSIVIVDNASSDGSDRALEERFPEVPLLKHSSNDGYSAGNNIGIRYAMEHGADYVLVTNNDVVVEPEFLTPMVGILGRDASIGIVTCKAFFQSGSDKLYGTAGSIHRFRCAGVGLPRELTDTECSVGFVSGCIFLCKREVFETVGLLDERFFMYFEDLEFSRRAGKKYRMIYTPRSVVYHKSGGGEGYQNFSPLYLYHMTRNRLWVFADEPFFYRSYVAIYSFMLVAVKLMLLIMQRFKGKPWPFVVSRTRALWNGLIDGYRGEGRIPSGKRF
jgi:GT2 family glycosyltransferase